MSTSVNFNGERVQLPGSYSRIISGMNNPPRDLDYGKLLIIDGNFAGTQDGQGIVGGAGVNGVTNSGRKALYKFTDITSFQEFVGRGWWWKAAQYLFNPDGRGQGVSEIIVVKPATTTPATITYSEVSTTGEIFKVKTLDESDGANGETNEHQATCVLTCTAPGGLADFIIVKLGSDTVATYVVQTSDVKVDIIEGLELSMNAIGIVTGVKNLVPTNPTLTVTAPSGTGAFLNDTYLAITIIDTAPGSPPTPPVVTVTNWTGGVNPTALYSGYAMTIESGVVNHDKFIFKFWKGSFKGLYVDGFAYDLITKVKSKPKLVVSSVEVGMWDELSNWCKTNSDFGALFQLDDNTQGSTLSIDPVLIAEIPGYIAAVDGTCTYDSLDETLEIVKEVNYNYVIAPYYDSGDVSANTDLLKVLVHLNTQAKYDKFLMVNSPVDISVTDICKEAVKFNSPKVNLVFDSILERSNYFASGFRTWDSFYHACLYLGRILGMAPEVPLTFKKLNIDGITTELTKKQKLQLDTAGVLATYYDEDAAAFCCLHDINTLQDSQFVLNNEGLSHLIQVERIKSQLNKELIVNSRLDLLSDPAGVNRNSLTPADAIEWTKGYLQRRIGTLIVQYRNVTAKVVQDSIFVEYEAMPNSEIKSMFFTGKLYL